ncbi:MAG TPA: hypothetical protein VKW06_20650 [Candidatus Angelobacter sp.]|nr:hypothetical protein [Candidatus Angelobacter sp.]
MHVLRSVLLLFACAIPASLSAGERLVYAVTSSTGSASATEVFEVAPGDVHPTQVFSDATLPVALGFMPQGAYGAPFQTAIAGKRLFSPGKERSSSDSRRATGIYEFALDSGKARKILDLVAPERVDLLAVDSTAATLAYLSLSANGLTLFVHDVATGKLLYQIDMTKIAGGCNVRNAGWLPDNRTIFFTLDEGADGFMSESDYKHVGSWLMNEDGTQLRKLPDSLSKMKPQGNGYRVLDDPTMLGALHEQYLFDSHVYQSSGANGSRGFLLLGNPKTGSNTSIAIDETPDAEFILSASGNYIAFVQREDQKFVGGRPVAPIQHVRIRPLPSGDAREVFTFQGDAQHRNALTLLGWSSD